MPKIKSYTPAWLSKPAPGYNLFAPPSEESRSSFLSSKSKPKPGPRRAIARSGTQVFVAVGKEVRWADLVDLKERWQERAARGRSGSRIKREDSGELNDEELLRASEKDGYAGFRTIVVPVGSDIRQLVISPHADFLAVLTTHTIRLCAVPDLSNLSQGSNDVIKPKSWTLGPTTHVVDQSPIASALWHPLGVNGNALVTVTTDAVVRVWELLATDRWSFDKPTLTIDLKKLADGTSLDQNFSASTNVRSKGFSPDSIEMDVASACFASRGSGGWSPMTLWLAMREGDVYALCPLLPSRWSPPPSLLPSLTVAIVGNKAAIENDFTVSPEAQLLAQQQTNWLADLDNQEPIEVNGPPGEAPSEIYTRPSRPGAVPKLQGPFDIELGVDSEDDIDMELTDIFVIGQKLDLNELMLGEEEELDTDDIDQEGLSLNIVCLLASSGQLRVCLDLDGVEAQWLPPRNKSNGLERLTLNTPYLLNFQTLDTLSALEMYDDGAWPLFSPDVTSRYGFYITHSSSITYVSLAPWVFRLESELQGESEAGMDFRIDLLVNGQGSARERLYTSPSPGDQSHQPLAAATAIRDPDLGYFLLSATTFEPIAMVFDAPEYEFEPMKAGSPTVDVGMNVQPLDFYQPRPTFQPPHIFEERSELPELLDRLRTSRHQAIVKAEVRLSPVALNVFMDVHQLLSRETYKQGQAASQLFSRLEALQVELQQQIFKANEVRTRVEAISGQDYDERQPESSNIVIERRLQSAKERNEAITQRLERIRKTVSKVTSRELSDKERAWIKEVNALDSSLNGSTAPPDGPSRLKQLGKRFDEARALREDLVQQADELIKAPTANEEDTMSGSPDLRIPSELRRAKISQVRGLLERQTTLVDAVKARLERLSVGG